MNSKWEVKAGQQWIPPQPHEPAAGSDPLAIDGYDHIEIFTECAKQTTFYLSRCFGFIPIAYKGPETGSRDKVSYAIKQGEAIFVISSALQMTSPIASLVLVHGMTVRDVAFRVKDCETFYYEAMQRGAKSAEIPTLYEDENGKVKRAAICLYGDTIHSIVERVDYKGCFFPGFIEYSKLFPGEPELTDAGIKHIDHVVGNVELGQMNTWVSFYERVLGFAQFQHFSDSEISTEYSALMSKVMSDGRRKVKMPINEPAHGKRKSQIEEYLQFHNGPGVQHVAFATSNILETVEALRKRGARFLRVPQTYYDEVPSRVGSIKEDLKKIANLGILVDRDDDGYLLQIFTKPLNDRPTLFFEIIQREGSQGFGVGNFKALFEAIEREQAIRGNL